MAIDSDYVHIRQNVFEMAALAYLKPSSPSKSLLIN